MFWVDSYLTRGNELSEETRADRARDFMGMGDLGREQEGKGTQEACSGVRSQSQVLGDGVSFWAVSGQSFSLRVLAGDVRIAQPRWIPARRILGGHMAVSPVSFCPSPNSFSWWWLVSYVLLTRISCRKTTHANGFCGAWAGRVALVSVFPNRTKAMSLGMVYRLIQETSHIGNLLNFSMSWSYCL